MAVPTTGQRVSRASQGGGRAGGQGDQVARHDQQERRLLGAAAEHRLPAQVLPDQGVQEQRRPHPGQRQHRRQGGSPGRLLRPLRAGPAGDDQGPAGGAGQNHGQGDRPAVDRPGVVPAAEEAGQGGVGGQPGQQGQAQPPAAVPGQPEGDEPAEQHHPHRGQQPVGDPVGDQLDDQPDQGDPGHADHQGPPPPEQPGDRGGQQPQRDHGEGEQGQAGQGRPQPVAVDADQGRHHQPQQLEPGDHGEGGHGQLGRRRGRSPARRWAQLGRDGPHRRSLPHGTTVSGLPKCGYGLAGLPQ